MTLTWYFFRQFIPPFFLGTFLFLSVLLLDKTFDLVDLVFNKGISSLVVGKIFMFFLPTALPLTIPMAILLGCIVTFGRLSEENEITAARAGGVSLLRIFWMVPAFALVLSIIMVPFNTTLAPYSNRAFRDIFQRIIQAEPLIQIEERKFFSIKNIKLFTNVIDEEINELTDVFVYQSAGEGRPHDRIFARKGYLGADKSEFRLTLRYGQLQRYDADDPGTLLHTTFDRYEITIPLEIEKDIQSLRFRNIPSGEIKKMIGDLKEKGLPTSNLEAENSLRYAMAFAPFALVFVGIPLATVLRRGGRTFSFGITLIVVFIYYLFLVSGLTLAEKALVPSNLALWLGNIMCFALGLYLFAKMVRK